MYSEYESSDDIDGKNSEFSDCNLEMGSIPEKNENEVQNKQFAALRVSSILTKNLIPKSRSSYFLSTLYFVLRTYQNATSVQRAIILRRVKEKKMQTGTVLSVEFEKSGF